MRPSRQLFATVKSAARYLEPNTPTGLTGLATHPTPRPALIHAYNQTLTRLKQLPESSVYRQSAEALTKHRLQIIESTKPPGFEEWHARIQKQIEDEPERYAKFFSKEGNLIYEEPEDEEGQSWDGKVSIASRFPEGSNTEAELQRKLAAAEKEVIELEHEEEHGPKIQYRDLEVEPPLTAEQIDDIETKMGAGLIEEVIQMARNELLVVDEMLESRVWEDLEEQAPPGQWEYFDRGDRV